MNRSAPRSNEWRPLGTAICRWWPKSTPIGSALNGTDAYRIAVNRRAALQHRTKQIKVNNLDGTQFAEFELHEGDQAVGQSIRALAPALPADCVLVSIRRGGRLVIPHGDTVLAAGDLVTTFVTEKTREEVGRVFRMGKVEQP